MNECFTFNEVCCRSPQVQRCSSLLNSDAFCCVCGGSNRDEFNYLLECSQCSIKVCGIKRCSTWEIYLSLLDNDSGLSFVYDDQVHQACYGVSRVPKGLWYCRPCHTNSKDIVRILLVCTLI